MKFSLFAGVLICSMSPFSLVYAQETQSSSATDKVEVSRTKITCSEDSQYSIKFTDGETHSYSVKAKVVESIRTTWKQGAREYRLSDSKSFDDKGDVATTLHAITEVESSEKNGLRTEKISVTQVIQYHGGRVRTVDGEPRTLVKHTQVMENVYAVDGNKSTFVKGTRDGKVDTELGSVTIETQDSPTQKTLKTIEQPGTRLDEQGNIIEVQKQEVICVHETL